jgi:hypothetical protein
MLRFFALFIPLRIENIIIHSECLCAQHQVVFYVSLITSRFSLSDTFFFIYTFFIIYCTLSRCRLPRCVTFQWQFGGTNSSYLPADTASVFFPARKGFFGANWISKKTALFPGGSRVKGLKGRQLV